MKPAILVPDVQTRAQLAALRSLGRAGYETHAAAADPRAMGLRSTFARHTATHPRYGDPAFCDWLAAYVKANAIRMIVPSGGLLSAVRERFSEFSPLLPVSPDPAIVYAGGDKIAAYDCWRAAGLLDHHPKTLVVRAGETPDLSGFPLPIYVKGGRGADGEVVGVGFHQCLSVQAAEDAIRRTLAAGYESVLVQGGVTGRQVGVSMLMGPDGPLAGNVVVDCHAEPHSKGTMSLRRTQWHQDVYDDAVRRLSALGWIGCAMVEYRRDDDSGDFHVIEVNARFWQYLHLDLHAGVDFPRLAAEWFLDGRIPQPIRPKQAVICRDTFPGEFAWLANALRRPGSKAARLGAFAWRFIDPRIHADLNFPEDRALYFREFGRFAANEIRALFRKMVL
ncbi:MAG: hypothetical protein U9R73_06715 [Pseudomonadota bacterium]|nr:hypothetical protein [Pseudomonadota bacterium]